MLSVHRYHEISEADHRILNPLREDQLDLIGGLLDLAPDQTVLDLGCGKGELLCRFAADHGTRGVGVDIHPPLLDVARARADELGVASRVTFLEGDAAVTPAPSPPGFDVVASIGTSWIGGGTVGTLELLRRHAAPAAWYLLGEVFWKVEPSAATRAAHEQGQTFADLAGTHARLEGAGFELVDLVLATDEGWDRYATSQWRNVDRWLRRHPDDPDATAVREWRDRSRRDYLAEERACLGWGVFVLRAD